MGRRNAGDAPRTRVKSRRFTKVVNAMPRGASPGEHRGGRKRGVPNKFSIARVERAIAEGRKQPPEELLRNAEDCRAMVVSLAPMRTNADTGQREPNPDHNPKDYFDWLAAERDALGRAAPY